MKARKPIFVSVILALLAAVMLLVAACGDDEPKTPKTYTMSFSTDGGTEIEPIKAMGGSMIFLPSNPQKSGYTFVGWYADAECTGDAVEIPNIMPNKNVTYYAKFVPNTAEYTITYVYNIGQTPHAKDIPSVTTTAGSSVTVADGNDYGAQGYMFMGWSVYPTGLVADVVQDGQYNAGDKITPTDSDIKLYAQWAVGYTDMRGVNGDVIYVYEPLIGSQNEAAIIVRDKKKLYGSVASSGETQSGYNEFTFQGSDFAGNKFVGRLNSDRTYAVVDDVKGEYIQYDNALGKKMNSFTLSLDGFGHAVYTEKVGDTLYEISTGDYAYDEDNKSYKYTYTSQTDETGAKAKTTYFIVNKAAGEFSMKGAEARSCLLFDPDVGDFSSPIKMIKLDGFGTAEIFTYGSNGEIDDSKTVSGKYSGTENYENDGEWQYVSAAQSFRFIITALRISDTLAYNIYIVRNNDIFGTYTADDGGKLYLDGYGEGQYITGGTVYEGRYAVNDSQITLTIDTNCKIVFKLTGDKFDIVTADTDFVKDENKINGYIGSSAVVVVPDGVTEIADDAFNYEKNKGNLSLVSVTIPQTVTAIGARAFQSNHTLRRATFLSETPIALDFSSGKDPFRWCSDDLIIVVPDNAVDAYKAAWASYAGKIKSASDAENASQAEFVIENGVLVAYNKPEGSAALLDITIPTTVTEIADGVFMGMNFIKSVNLSNVVTVGNYAFYGCANLEKVVMTKVQTLGSMAFEGCEKLNNSGTKDLLELAAIKTVGSYAFYGCHSLVNVKLGESLEQIDDFAFYLCNVYNDAAPLAIELAGDKAPVMGNHVTLGNIAVKFKVQSTAIAIKCYKEESWSEYYRLLYTQSGDEKGAYMSGGDMIVLDGNATYSTSSYSYVWMYEINENAVKFYEYDDGGYNTIIGTIKNGVITVAIGSRTRRFTLVTETSQFTYKSKDGAYTLVCNPNNLRLENLAGGSGDVDVTFNGKNVKLHLAADGTKTIFGYKDTDNKLYDITISFDAETLSVVKKLATLRYALTATDGSKITVLIKNGVAYIESAQFNIDADGGKLHWGAASGMAVVAQQNGKTYTFSLRYRNTQFSFTVNVDTDKNTFTYTKK